MHIEHQSGRPALRDSSLTEAACLGQVLVFSQFKIMLNVIEDALKLAGLPTERIDGSVASRDRQTAIDRFSKGRRKFGTTAMTLLQ